MVSARRKNPHRPAPSPRWSRSARPSGDSVARVECWPCGRAALGREPERHRDRLDQRGLARSRSRRRGRSRPATGPAPRAASWATAGIVIGHRSRARPAVRVDRPPARTGGWSKSMAGPLGGPPPYGWRAWPSKSPSVEIEVDDRVVRVTNPDRVYFPESGATKLDLVEYYLAVGPGIVNALFERPCMLHRFPKGLAGDKVHQKRLPAGAPPWVETVRLHFPRWNRTADELCVTELGAVIWAVQMSTVEFHPWNSRRDDTEKPDEWRIDLDPGPLSRLRTGTPRGPRRARGARRARRGRLPQDQRQQGHARLRPDRARPRPQGRTPRGAGLRPRGRAPCARRRDHASGGARTATRTTCSSTTTRTPATTPSPRRTRSAACPTPASPPRSAGTRSTTPTPTTSRSSRSRERFAELGDLHADIDDHVFDIAPAAGVGRPRRGRGPGDAETDPDGPAEARRATATISAMPVVDCTRS